MEKRFQVFVSSTFNDLEPERLLIFKTLMDLGCIPAGMELFPAIDENQWNYITHVIDESDYYVLVIGGRYGSLSKEGVSYTEQEFDYATSRNIPILAFLHGDPGQLPFNKSEQDPARRMALATFIQKVKSGRLLRFWNTPQDLATLVATSLPKTWSRFPGVGWVRGDQASDAVRADLAKVQRDLNVLRNAVEAVLDLSGIDDIAHVTVCHTADSRALSNGSPSQTSCLASWRDIFQLISEHADGRILDDSWFSVYLAGHFLYRKGIKPKVYYIEEASLQHIEATLSDKFNLIKVSRCGTSRTTWALTDKGHTAMIGMGIKPA